MRALRSWSHSIERPHYTAARPLRLWDQLANVVLPSCFAAGTQANGNWRGWLAKTLPNVSNNPTHVGWTLYCKPSKGCPPCAVKLHRFHGPRKTLGQRGGVVVAEVSLERIWWFWGGSVTTIEAPPLFWISPSRKDTRKERNHEPRIVCPSILGCPPDTALLFSH